MVATFRSWQLCLLLLLHLTSASGAVSGRSAGKRPGPTTAFAPVHRHLGGSLGPSVFESTSHIAEAPFSTGNPVVALGTRELRSIMRTIDRPRRLSRQLDAAVPPDAFGQIVLGALATHSSDNGDLMPDRSADARIAAATSDLSWEEVVVSAPDLDDMPTLVELAKMANDAYALPGQPRWMELDTYNLTVPFGWEDEAAGLRGHLFASADNATLVLSIKGTSIDGPLPPKGRSTARLDQLNDNLFFSCCCGTLPSDVCSCKVPFGDPLGRKRRTCDEDCLTEGLFGPNSYYPEAVALLAQVRVHYPMADIWLVGHSLGGVVAGLLGLTFGLPAVTFEAPPDALVVGRLGLRVPRAEANPVTHVFHTGDMIATGSCRGPLSACGRGGYSMESSCKQGNLRVYDTVGKWGWGVDRTGRSHTIQWVIDNVYSKPWNNGEIEGPEGRGRDWTDVPRPTVERQDCVDCAGWKFV